MKALDYVIVSDWPGYRSYHAESWTLRQCDAFRYDHEEAVSLARSLRQNGANATVVRVVPRCPGATLDDRAEALKEQIRLGEDVEPTGAPALIPAKERFPFSGRMSCECGFRVESTIGKFADAGSMAADLAARIVEHDCLEWEQRIRAIFHLEDLARSRT